MKKQNIETKEAEIRKKLAQSGITSAQEFEEIISNLKNQKERLEYDLQLLKSKVLKLELKNARKQSKRKEVSNSKGDYLKLKNQLAQKYDFLRKLQKKSYQTIGKVAIEMEVRSYLDKCFVIEQQIQNAKNQLKDQKKVRRQLRKALKFYDQQSGVRDGIREGIQKQNTLLKKRVWKLRKIVDDQLNKEVHLHNYLYEMKQRQKDYKQLQQNILRELQNEKMREKKSSIVHYPNQNDQDNDSDEASSSTVSISSDGAEIPIQQSSPHKKAEVYQVEGRLNREERRIKTEVEQIEKKIKTAFPNEALKMKREGSRLSFSKQIQLLLNKNRVLMETFNELNRTKIQLLSNLQIINKMGSEEKSQRNTVNQFYRYTNKNSILKTVEKDKTTEKKFTMRPSLELKFQSRAKSNHSIHNKIKSGLKQQYLEDKYTQTIVLEQKDENPLRYEFVGTLDEGKYSDRMVLKDQKLCSIKSLYIFYSDRGIAAVRAVYVTPKGKQIESKIKVGQSFIKNYCKIFPIETSHDDFIRYFKIRYNKLESRVVHIRIVTNRNLKYSFGDSKIKKGDEDEDQIYENTEVQNQYIFDINQDEFPVCIFGAHCQRGPYWYLSAFGVEINQL